MSDSAHDLMSRVAALEVTDQYQQRQIDMQIDTITRMEARQSRYMDENTKALTHIRSELHESRTALQLSDERNRTVFKVLGVVFLVVQVVINLKGEIGGAIKWFLGL